MPDSETASKRDVLVTFLRDSDARCPACRYALRGGESDRCPECGQELILTIAAPRGTSGWWLAGVIGLSATAVFDFMMLLAVTTPVANELQHPGLRAQVRAGLASTSELPAWTPILFLGILLLAIALALANLVSHRERFKRWSWWRRAVVGLLAAASPLLIIAALAVFSQRVT